MIPELITEIRWCYLSASTRVLDSIKIQEKYSPPITEKSGLEQGTFGKGGSL